jgi:plastocyanin
MKDPMLIARPLRALAVASALIIGLVACSSGASTTPTATTAGAGTPSAATGSGAAASDSMVMLMNFAFGPTTLTVPLGTTVTFTNMDSTEHTVTNGKDGKAVDNPAFDEKVASGESVTVTFDTAGTFDVTCMIHPTMNMTVTVQ